MTDPDLNPSKTNQVDSSSTDFDSTRDTEEPSDESTSSKFASNGEGAEFATKQPRDDVLTGVTQRLETGYGKLYVTINEDGSGQPFELFANIGNSGGFTASFTESLAKTISTALRSGVDPEEIASELRGIRSPKIGWDKGEKTQSIPDAIGVAMERYLEGELELDYPQQQNLAEAVETDTANGHRPDGGTTTVDASDTEGDQEHENNVDATAAILEDGESPECQECGAMSLCYSEGCKTCRACGWSEC